MDNRVVTRRTVLRSAAGSAVVAGGLVAGACTSDAVDVPGGQRSDRVTLPAYVPWNGVTADHPATADGVQAAFLSYPANTPSFTEDGFGGGAMMTSLSQGDGPIVPLDKNRRWRELHQRLDVEVKFDITPNSVDYPRKLATVLAGGDIPDFVHITSMPNLPQALAAQFQDLTEFLSGDAVKEFPALANIPTGAWQETVFNGAIYGWPTSQASCGNTMLVRDDYRRAAGVTSAVSSGEDFLELCRALTNPQQNRWALTAPTETLVFVLEMLGGPNLWRVDGGKFIRSHETDEAKRALEIIAAMWKEGLFYPDAFGTGLSPYATMRTGRIAMLYRRFAVWGALIRDNRPADPAFDIGAIPPPHYEGGGLAKKFLDRESVYITAMKQTDDKSRIKTLLRVVNWLCAPFGTEEFQLRTFGIPDYSFTLVNGAPSFTEAGLRERTLPLGFIGSPPSAIWQPTGEVDVLRKNYEYQKEVLSNVTAYPLAGLYSETDASKGAALEKKMVDLQGDIIQGRKPLSDWDEGVKTWRAQGGDDIRREYEASFQERMER